MNHSSSIVFGLVSLVCCLQSVIFCLESCVCCLWFANGPSTTVEDSLQIGPFMQNKPNFQKAKMNVSIYYTKVYKNETASGSGKNKPNSNPNKPNLRKAKMNVNSLITKDYRKNDDFVVRKNKPNFRNGQNERKLNFNKGLQKKRLFRSPKNKPNSNPIKACPELAEALSVAEGAVEWANFRNNECKLLCYRVL